MPTGGIYYQFEVFGLTLELLRNAGDVQIPERRDWPFYLLLYCNRVSLNEDVLKRFAEYAVALLMEHGIEAEVDSLS